MDVFKPQVQLAYELKKKQGKGFLRKKYFLHCVTFCDQMNYEADGWEVQQEGEEDFVIDQDNALKVILKVKENPSLPSFESITPVVHTIKLGFLEISGDSGSILVEMVGNNGKRKSRSDDGDEGNGQTEVKTSVCPFPSSPSSLR